MRGNESRILVPVLDKRKDKEYRCNTCFDYGILLDISKEIVSGSPILVVCDCIIGYYREDQK